MNTQELLSLIDAHAKALKAEEVCQIEVAPDCTFADTFVIMSGNSTVQNQAIAEKIAIDAKHAGRPASSIEGMTPGDWILLDFGDVIVHIMTPEKREYYALEELWAQGQFPSPRASATEEGASDENEEADDEWEDEEDDEADEEWDDDEENDEDWDDEDDEGDDDEVEPPGPGKKGGARK